MNQPCNTRAPRRRRRLRLRALLAPLAAIALVVCGCSDDSTDSANASTSGAADGSSTTAPVKGAEHASKTSGGYAEFCDGVADFDAVDPPGAGEDDPTPADLEAFASAIGPAVESIAAHPPEDVADATATLTDAQSRAAKGDPSVNEDPALDAALQDIEQAVRDNCDVATVDVVAHDFSFDVPDSVPAGPVSFQVTNEGENPHVFLLAKAPEGDPADDVEFLEGYLGAANGGGDVAEYETYDVPGTPVFTEPGKSGATVKVLEPGEYVYFCPIPMDFSDPTSKTHMEEGMHGRFTVS